MGGDDQRKTSLSKMEKPVKKSRILRTDSIKKLAQFWDGHDLTDFEDELEEVGEPVFVCQTAIKDLLETHEAEAVKPMAQAKGVSPEQLVRAWVLQKVARRNGARASNR
jgi:hypothetical protein